MLFRSFVLLSIFSFVAAVPAPLDFQEDCDCTTKVVTTTVKGTPTVMTSIIPSSAISSWESVASSYWTGIISTATAFPTIPTGPVVTVTITESVSAEHHHHPSTTGTGHTVTVTETASESSHPTGTEGSHSGHPTTTHAPTTATADATSVTASTEDCDGTTEYTTVTALGSLPTNISTESPESTSNPAPPSDSNGQCGGAPVQCCNSVDPATSKQGRHSLAMIGREHEAESFGDQLVGSQCTAPAVGVLPGGTCGGTPVCCQSTGVVSIGCVPVQL